MRWHGETASRRYRRRFRAVSRPGDDLSEPRDYYPGVDGRQARRRKRPSGRMFVSMPRGQSSMGAVALLHGRSVRIWRSSGDAVTATCGHARHHCNGDGSDSLCSAAAACTAVATLASCRRGASSTANGTGARRRPPAREAPAVNLLVAGQSRRVSRCWRAEMSDAIISGLTTGRYAASSSLLRPRK